MKKKLNIILVMSLLFFSTPSKPLMDAVATSASIISWPVYFLICNIFNGPAKKAHENATAIMAIGAVGLSAVTYATLFQFTPQSKLNKANKIVEELKGKYLHIFDGAGTQNKDQILFDLGAYEEMYKDERNFVNFNALEELDYIICKLKRAESLLMDAKKDVYPSLTDFIRLGYQVAKKDIYPSVVNFFKAGFSKISAQSKELFKSSASARLEDLRHQRGVEFEGKIDFALAKVQEMLAQTAKIYLYIEAQDAIKFKAQLKEREELRALRAQNRRSEVMSKAISVATGVGSVVLLMVSAGGLISALKSDNKNRRVLSGSY